ncbi:MAG: DUF1150 domain-containing protein [Hyphomicrobiales bacterium]|nr:DUF1150 domain-containing protein [Hyphomicrobiales bacterium]
MNQDLKDTGLGSGVISSGDLAMLGNGEIAYIRPLKATDVKKLFPQLTGIPEGIDLFAVYTADGTPLALTDSLNAALANVMENDLAAVSVH